MTGYIFLVLPPGLQDVSKQNSLNTTLDTPIMATSYQSSEGQEEQLKSH